MTYQEYQALSHRLIDRAKACRGLIVDRARKVARRAGLDPQIAFLHAHNAIISREYGKPWPEVDYSLARRVLWLEARSWEPERIASRILDRAWKEVTR